VVEYIGASNGLINYTQIMQRLQDVFIKHKSKKAELKEIKNMYKDALENLEEYRKIDEQLKNLKLRKKQIEQEVKNDLGKEWVRLEALKKDIDGDKELMASLAIDHMLKGEEVIVEDEEGIKHEPHYTVKFKKAEEGVGFKK